MVDLDGRRTTVNRLRVRGRAADRLTAQARAGQFLEDATAQPDSLPPAAILYIRRLSDPRPGVVTFDTRSPPPPQWSRAVRSAIDERARDAARPAWGEVPADAGAVMFADRAEMLACLAADCCSGSLGQRWWWRVLLSDSADDEAVLRAWLAAPQYLAAAFEQTARLGVAARFIGRFGTDSVRALLGALAVEHHLRSLTPAIERLTGPRAFVAQQGLFNRWSAPDALAPWSPCVPECATTGLRLDQQCLLGVALALRRQPWRVRTTGFAAQVDRWSRDAGRSTEVRDQQPRHQAVEPTAARALPMPGGPLGDWRAANADSVVTSQVGGVFYLLNVAIALGLYGDFTKPREPGIDLAIWDFVRGVGWHLAPRRFRRDPVWKLLAGLAGRDARARQRASPWVSQSLVPHLRSRIARALGVAKVRHADAVLCVHRARVVTSPAHLDVFFSLTAHPLTIRLAGLDRDPGWIPAADRIVTFHYDQARRP